MAYPDDAVRLVPSARQCTRCGAMVKDEASFDTHYNDKHAPEDDPDGDD